MLISSACDGSPFYSAFICFILSSNVSLSGFRLIWKPWNPKLILTDKEFRLFLFLRRQLLADIHLDEDVLKTSFVFVFTRRLDQDEYVQLSLTSSEVVFKTSSRRLGQDQYICLGHTSSRRLQDVLKTSSRRLAQMSLRRLQNVFKTFSRRLQDVFKMFWRRFKTSSRHLQDVLQRHFQDVLKAYHQVNLF